MTLYLISCRLRDMIEAAAYLIVAGSLSAVFLRGKWSLGNRVTLGSIVFALLVAAVDDVTNLIASDIVVFVLVASLGVAIFGHIYSQ